MEISVAQQARDVQRLSRRRITRENKDSDPSLRILLGHCMVYHHASKVVQEDVFDSSEDEQLLVDEEDHTDLYDEYRNMEHDDTDNDEDEQQHQLWKIAYLDENQDLPPPAYSEIDALSWLLPSDDKTLECEKLEEPVVDMPKYEPPMADETICPEEDHWVDPLRQHPPTSDALSKDTMQEWRPRIFAVPRIEIHRSVIVLQLAEALFTALKKLGIKKSKGPEKDDGPDVEAQIDMQSMSADVDPATNGRNSPTQMMAWVS